MTLTPDFSIFTEGFTNTWTIGTSWLIPLAITFLMMALITKDTEKWKVLAFPLMVLQRIMGMPVHFVIMSISGIVFVVEALSLQVIGNIIGPAKKWISADKVEIEKGILKKYDRAVKHEKKIAGMPLTKVSDIFGGSSKRYKKEVKRHKTEDYIKKGKKKKISIDFFENGEKEAIKFRKKKKKKEKQTEL